MQDAATNVTNATSIRADAQYVRVDFREPLTSADDAATLHLALEQAFAAHGMRRVLFDASRAGGGDEVVRDTMWTWIESTGLEAIAVIVDAELARVRLNMTALSKRLPLRAFIREVDAIAWLTDPEQRRPTREVRRG
jgi:hypothetical protein